ncbi:hypothetical protein [Clostridium sp.]|uniref:hypothetical protein n=1 Tax=Clostridium sp. TaxID=1506 RepID=UPI003522895A
MQQYLQNLSIALIQLWYSREIVDVSWIKETYKYWVAGILMLVLVSLMGEGTQRNFIILAKTNSNWYSGILWKFNNVKR